MKISKIFTGKRILFSMFFLFFCYGQLLPVYGGYRDLKRNTGHTTRTALVIGNAGYKDSPLANPVNDARDIAGVLEKKGFKVTLLINSKKRQMDDAIRSFGRKLRHGGVGLFYFAGHGVQYKGRNYLVPVNARIDDEADIEYETVDANKVLSKMELAGNDVNIVILDACRNNPFARSFRSARHGLAQMDAPTGSLLAYATSPGSVAADGKGRNGVYTKYLLQYMDQPGLSLSRMFMKVRRAVLKETGRKQTPWESSSLTGEFYFDGGTTNDPEEELWKAVSGSRNAEELQMYLDAYPRGRFVQLARLQIRRAARPVTTPVVPQPVQPQNGDTWTDPTTGMEFVYVKGGCYQMGDTFGDGDGDGDDDEKPHKVCVDDFYMGKYEVTQGEWQKIFATNPSRFKKGNNYPVEEVNWYEAASFANHLSEKAGLSRCYNLHGCKNSEGHRMVCSDTNAINSSCTGYRLPTESQWEYAARSGGKKEKYSGGNDVDAVAWYDGQSGPSTHPVGQKQKNGIGLYDMSGNVSEWCSDWYGKKYYNSSPRNNPQGPSSGRVRVYRGGSWYKNARYLRSADRNYNSPGNRHYGIGFRLLRTLL